MNFWTDFVILVLHTSCNSLPVLEYFNSSFSIKCKTTTVAFYFLLPPQAQKSTLHSPKAFWLASVVSYVAPPVTQLVPC